MRFLLASLFLEDRSIPFTPDTTPLFSHLIALAGPWMGEENLVPCSTSSPSQSAVVSHRDAGRLARHALPQRCCGCMRLPSLQARQQRAARTAPDVLAGRCAAVLISPIPRPSPWICAWRLAVVDLVVALGLQSLELLVLHGYETADLVLAFASLFELRSCRIERHSHRFAAVERALRTCPNTKTAPSPKDGTNDNLVRKDGPFARNEERAILYSYRAI